MIESRCQPGLTERVLPQRHRPDCEELETCSGCQPCPHRHCQMPRCPGRHLDPSQAATCTRCLDDTRTDLAAVVQLAAHLDLEAQLAGIESEAANLAGPSADPEAWRHHQASAQVGRIEADWQEPESHNTHPEWILGTWAWLWRQQRNEPTALELTTQRAASYLDARLDQIAQDTRLDFAHLASEVHQTRRALENVLRAGDRHETGAPCPRCGQPEEPGPPLIKSYSDTDTSGASDTWSCPACHTSWSEADYRLRVAGEYLDHATRLTADQLARRLDVPVRTVYRWAATTSRYDTDLGTEVTEPPLVRTSGHDERGRRLLNVADAEQAAQTRRPQAEHQAQAG